MIPAVPIVDRSRRFGRAALLGLMVAASSADGASPAPPRRLAQPLVIDLPDGGHGIALGHVVYVAELGRLVVPAGSTGSVVLVDPQRSSTRTIRSVGVSSAMLSEKVEGLADAAYGAGVVFVADRSARKVLAIDPASATVIERYALEGEPGQLQFVASRDELWVTEPSAQRIQVISYRAQARPRLSSIATIQVAQGSVALSIDEARGRAYTNLWTRTTLVLDLATRTEVARWPNGCTKAPALALDAERAVLLVGCAEGRVTTFSLPGGAQLASVRIARVLDDLSYSPKSHRAHVVSAADQTLTVLDVAATGALSVVSVTPLESQPDAARDAALDDGVSSHSTMTSGVAGRTVSSARVTIERTSAPGATERVGARCVASDDATRIFVCDPDHGRILIFEDR